MKIKPDKEMVLADLLMAQFSTGSRSMIKKIISHGNVSVNGNTILNQNHLVRPGDVVEYVKHKAPPGSQDCPFPVLFEDDHLMVVVKPAGILTYGEKGTHGTSLYRELTEYVRDRTKGKGKIFVVHRLDREVSGILIFAKSESVQKTIKENWKETEKRYYALVEGRLGKPEGKLEDWMLEGYDQKVFTLKKERPGAKMAITHYTVLKELKNNTTLVEIRLETGRKHQIRVHMAEMGTPIVGDFKYGADKKVKRRIRLHSHFFSFNHPVTGEHMEFDTRMPKGFLTLGDADEHYKW